ncbi:uncharacterized protein BDV17DRAFT_259924 [Aspergillus undulatus]|uniref:uncharacterized protein n=1 Tax=Aspergillus undulatus TaxID=1810928 RepID=UPI003CCE02F0
MTRMKHHTLLILLPLFTTAAAVCYYPNGESDPNPLNGKCVSIEGFNSPCCATNRTNPSGGSLADGRTSDLCMENGLCKNVATSTDDDGEETVITEYWRGLCTSSEWPESSCLDVCGTGQGAGRTMQLTPCDGTDNSTEWCCGTSDSCCGTSNAVTIAPVLAALASSSASPSASPSPTPSESITATPTPVDDDAKDDKSSSSGLSAGAKAGIGVGVGVGAILILGVLVFWWMRRSKATVRGHAPTPSKPTLLAERDFVLPPQEKDQQRRIVEMDGGNMYELQGEDGMRHELPVARHD